MNRDICTWNRDADGWGFTEWTTGCGERHTFKMDGPAEHKHNYCPYCGGAIDVYDEDEFVARLN